MSDQAQGALGLTLAQMMMGFGTLATGVQSKKIYVTNNTLGKTLTTVQSNILSGGVRHPVQSVRDKVDLTGNTDSEMNANTLLWFAALGSIESEMTGGTFGTALTTPTAVIGSNGLMTVSAATHGLEVGDSVQIAGIDAPTELNDKIFAVVSVPTAGTFVVPVPLGVSGTFTLGSGTIKKVTAVGTTLTHTFKAGGRLPFYRIEKGFPDIGKYFDFKSCLLGSLSFGIPASGLIPMTVTWLGGTRTAGTSSFETGTTLDNGKRLFDALDLAAADVKLGGSAIATITNISNFALDNKLDGNVFVLGGGGNRGGINPGKYSISAQITALYDGNTLIDLSDDQTETSLDLTFKRGTGDGTDGNETLQIVTPEGILTMNDPGIEGEAGILINGTFNGYYDNAAAGTALEVIVKNAVLPGALI